MIRLALIIGFLAAGAGVSLAAADKALLHAREGAAALLRGKYDRAIASYSEALKSKNLQDPRRANIYNDRGVAKWRLKRAKEAIQDFNEAIELFGADVVIADRAPVGDEIARLVVVRASVELVVLGEIHDVDPLGPVGVAELDQGTFRAGG